ncbi:hypothetical protein [Pontiella sulfatireligans]|uniref:Uncharacterized protein n=1 Tax=Pontiella sulfatireligans TaxID=2750658 RepID=A0A6C2UPS2_9BACT|nr:hypothetical protein [Pontiella sulfatireligans]VGO21314.1 hypothetical protein SCARR_03386 [Pontiella sulfatireligans]
MKFLRGFFIFLGVLALTGALAIGISFLLKPSEVPTSEGIGAISPEMVAQAQEVAQEVGKRMAWVMVLVSAMLQIFAWIAALAKMKILKKSDFGAAKKLELLEAIDIYFDLPLYFGLLGSVGSFIVITFFPDAGLMFAYASTAMGIIVSVILRLGYNTPFKQELLTSPALAE